MASVDGQLAARDGASYSSLVERRTLTGSLARLEVVSSSPPTIGNISPAPGTITRAQAISLRATDALGLATLVVIADYASGRSAVIHDGTSFQPGFTAGSSRTPTTGGYDLVLAEDGGWLGSFTLRTVVVNTSGVIAVTNAALAYTVSDPPPPPDVTAPAISNVEPAVLSDVGRLDPIFFDVTDAGELGRVIVAARFVNGAYEVVHDGNDFAAGYAAQSTRTAITDGYRYRVRRTAGWPSLPGAIAPMTIAVWAVDSEGNAS